MNWRDGLLLADASAWARKEHAREPWAAAEAADRIVTCGPAMLELLFVARGLAEVTAVEASFTEMRELSVGRSTYVAARRAMRDLAATGSHGAHRIPGTDILIAACAAEHGAAVLHYDAHFDRLAEVLSFRSVWVAPRGSL